MKGRGRARGGQRFETTVVRRVDRPPMSPGETRRFVRRLARRLSIGRGSLAVVYGSDEMLRDLNKRFRRVDRPTDVLSFPSGEEPEPGGGYLGDVVLSAPAIRAQARGRHSAARETERLLIHGFLHLLGYDHEVDDGQMELLERTLRRELLGRGGRA